METKLETIKLYGGSVTLLFDREKHAFYKDGKRLTGVTTYTGVLDKPALVPWAVKMMGIYIRQSTQSLAEFIKKIESRPKFEFVNPEKLDGIMVINDEIIEAAKREYRNIREEAAEKGKEAHTWAEEWTKGNKPKMPKDSEIRNAVAAFLDWFKQSGIKITSQERFIYSKKYNYAGIMDWEGKKDGSLLIGDYKTTNAIYDEMRFQLALYWQAREEETGKEYDEGHIIQFGKQTAEFNRLLIPRREYLKDLKAALGCVQIKNRLNELRYGNS